MNKHEFYKMLIADAADSVSDIDLLDFVYKLLIDGADEKPADEKVVYLFREMEAAA